MLLDFILFPQMLIRAIVWKALLVLLALSHFNKMPLQGVLCHIIASISHTFKTAA